MRWPICLLLLLASCDRSHRCYPELSPEGGWTSVEMGDSELPPDEWWELFEDPCLSALIERAHANNYSLQASYERVVQAFYLRREVSAKYFPQIDATYDAMKAFSQVPIGPGLFGGDAQQGLPPVSFGKGVRQDAFLGGFDATWEIDFFKHTYYEVQATCAGQAALMEAHRSVMVTLASEIARNYLTVRWQQQRACRLSEEIALLERRLDLNVSLKERGIVDDFPYLDTLQQSEQLKEAYQESLATAQSALYTLVALLGDLPEDLLETLCCLPAGLPGLPSTLPIGLPAELLRRRPDIRQAEMEIAQAASMVDVAIADFFPRITLLGSLQAQRTSFGGLSATGPGWTLGLHLLSPVFRAGQLRAQLAEKRSAWRERLYTYYDSVAHAVAEAEGALATFAHGNEGREAAFDAYTTREASQERTEALRRAGIINEINLIDADLALVDSQIAWEEAHYNQLINTIAVYKALGGGWGCDE